MRFGCTPDIRSGTISTSDLTALLTLAGAAGATTAPSGPVPDSDIAAKAAHEIRMYPRYSIWDNINVRSDGSIDAGRSSRRNHRSLRSCAGLRYRREGRA